MCGGGGYRVAGEGVNDSSKCRNVNSPYWIFSQGLRDWTCFLKLIHQGFGKTL